MIYIIFKHYIGIVKTIHSSFHTDLKYLATILERFPETALRWKKNLNFIKTKVHLIHFNYNKYILYIIYEYLPTNLEHINFSI